MCELLFNPFVAERPDWSKTETAAFYIGDIVNFHRSLPEYQPTPLVSLPALAAKLGVAEIVVKDESRRFGLKAFKGLGASYGIYRFLKQKWEARTESKFDTDKFHSRHYRDKLGSFTFCTATDGNHGRAVAWTAKKLGEGAVIYVLAHTVAARIEAIAAEDAEVVIVDGTYDDAVARVQHDARANGWQIISDTSYSGYTNIPRSIMAGYTTMFREIDDARSDTDAGFDLIFIQAGVGALAAAATWYYVTNHQKQRPRLIGVEPIGADCLRESIRAGDGNIHSSQGRQDSIMAGLNCGTPSVVAWPFVRQAFNAFMSVSDDYSKQAMRQLYYPLGDDARVISGESGAAGLAALLLLSHQDDMSTAREKLGLGGDATILLLNTEGDTDPVNFKRVIGISDQHP